MDGEISQALHLQVETHLAGCASCRGKLESLKSMVNQLGQMPKADAPPDFMDRLHDRLEKQTWAQKIRHTLFVPSGIKIPLELAAAVSVGILIFFIAQPIQQHLLPKKQVDHQSAVAEKGKPQPPIIQPLEAELQPLTPPPAAPSSFGVSKKKTIPPPKDLEMMKEVREYKGQDVSPGGHIIARAPVTNELEDMQIKDESASAPIVITLMVPAQKEFGRLSAVEESPEPSAGPSNELAKRKSTVLSGAASSLPQKAEEDAAIPAAPAPSESNEAIDQKIIELVNHFQGRLISMERNEKGLPISMKIEIPASTYNQFIDQILRFGEIESRPHSIPSSGEELIPMIIHLIIHPY
jgi:cell envelope opacity-associated protein A